MAVEIQCLFSIGSVLHPSEGGPRCRPNMLAAITGHGDVSAIVILVRSDHWMRCFRIRRGSIREILRLVRACTLFCPFWGAQSFRKRSPVFFGARRPRSEIKIGEHTCASGTIVRPTSWCTREQTEVFPLWCPAGCESSAPNDRS